MSYLTMHNIGGKMVLVCATVVEGAAHSMAVRNIEALVHNAAVVDSFDKEIVAGRRQL